MPHILLIEDNPGDARLIRELLKDIEILEEPYEITHVERVGEATEKLRDNNNYDLVLSDITLPDSRGVDTLRSLSKASALVPIIFMTGTNDEALALIAIHQGAQDYIIKGSMDSTALSKSIQYAVERKKFQNQLDAATAKEVASQQKIQHLDEQKRQLENLNRTKDEFVSLASHQLRTPATAVKQYIGMILEGFTGDVSQQQLELLRTAYESNERQLHIINELLKTAQLDSAKAGLQLSEQNITAIVCDVLTNHKPVLEMRNQTVVFNSDKDYMATVDTNELRLVIENIIENASKYTPKGKAITITFEQQDKCLLLSIRDEGVGISKANQHVIFEKFTRVDNALSDTVTGTGLGLYWAKRIMELHDGSVSVESDGTHGSTFTIRIPT